MLLPRHHHIALAVFILVGAQHDVMAESTPFKRQERVGLALNIPFGGQGILFKDATVSLVYQKAEVDNHVAGFQLSVGSTLHTFSPVFALGALGGERCTYASLGVSYGPGGWGIPVALHGPHVQVGLNNVGGFGGAFAGISTMGCFKRYEPPAVAAPVPVPPPQSSGGSQNVADASGWLRNAPTAPAFDWA